MNELTITEITMTSLEIAERTGKRHDNVMRDIRNMLLELYGEGDALKFEGIYLDAHKREKPCYRLPKKECLCLVSGYSAPLRMAIITRLEELETTHVAIPTLPETRAKAELDYHLFIQDYLKTSEVSKLAVIHDVTKRHGIPTKYLPAYVKETPITFAAKDLLAKHGTGLSSIAFNKLMMATGLLEDRERTGHSGKIKRYKALTKLGLKYGQNDTSPHNPREIQPHYYEDTFGDLLEVIL